MKPPAPPRSIGDLRSLTPARVALGRSGAGLPTDALLAFTLDHARARDAVHAGFDTQALMAGLRELGLSPLELSSRAQTRRDYLRRPDLGRMLDAESQRLLDGPAWRRVRPCHRRSVTACRRRRSTATPSDWSET